MPRRTGSATLPLHGGRAPAWLFERMARLAVDSAAVQVGFDIYHHSFFLSSDGEWAVVQQGMRDDDHTARRYYWLGSRACSTWFSVAHAGKDRHPYPVNREVYDHLVEWLRDAVTKARIGRSEQLHALKRLAEFEQPG